MLEEIVYKGFRIEVDYDPDAESPRSDDNVWTFVCWHSRYRLSDPDIPKWDSPQDFRKWWKPRSATGLLQPLYLYDHSGITISTGDFGDRWDSGQVGWAYLTSKDLRKHFKLTPDARVAALETLQAEVEDYATYLEGRVYYYDIYRAGEEKAWDSCCGIFGDSDEAVSMAKEICDMSLTNAVRLLPS